MSLSKRTWVERVGNNTEAVVFLPKFSLKIFLESFQKESSWEGKKSQEQSFSASRKSFKFICICVFNETKTTCKAKNRLTREQTSASCFTTWMSCTFCVYFDSSNRVLYLALSCTSRVFWTLDVVLQSWICPSRTFDVIFALFSERKDSWEKEALGQRLQIFSYYPSSRLCAQYHSRPAIWYDSRW